MKFKPAVEVDNIQSEDPSQSRRAIAGAAKNLLSEEDAEQRHGELCILPTQGDKARRLVGCGAELWARAVQCLPLEPMKFALMPPSIPFLPMPTFTLGVRSLQMSVPSTHSTDSLLYMSSITAL